MSEKSAPARRNTFKSPKPDPIRTLVFDILQEVNQRGGYSNLLLPSALTDSKFEQRDKGFATELLYGTLRMQGRHDYIASKISDRPWSEVDSGIVDVVRLGAHQLFEMRVATHAAVSETVELARKVLGESKASFVNAMLRKMSAQTLDQWMEPVKEIKDDVARLAILHSHPEWIVSAYFDLLKDFAEVEAALISNNIPAAPTLVWWPGRSSQAELIELGGTPTAFSKYGMKFDGMDPERAARDCVDVWKNVLPHAEKKGITLVLEHLNSRDSSHPMKGHPGYFGDDVEFCVELIKRVGNSNFKLLFDIYHVSIMNGDVIRRFQTHRDLIGHVHTAGNPGRCELDSHQEICYPAVMKAVVDAGYHDFVAHEFIPTWPDPILALRHAAMVCDV
jgi:transcription termination factor NusB